MCSSAPLSFTLSLEMNRIPYRAKKFPPSLSSTVLFLFIFFATMVEEKNRIEREYEKWVIKMGKSSSHNFKDARGGEKKRLTQKNP
jgi:hypothetical protein